MKKKTTRKMSKQKKKQVVASVIFLIGFAIFTYPFYQNAFSQYLDQQIIRQFQKESAAQNEAELAELKAEMAAENERKQAEADLLAKELAAAEALLATAAESSAAESQDYFVKHTLGVLTIPAINGEMPIYDQGTEAFLSKEASLLNGSSLPVGGESTHAVIMAHRGMPEAELFSKLPQVKEGDLFFIEINGDTLAYEVDQIKIIEPTDIEDLLIVPDEDYVTLMTCTPYMVNSHRYLVRGKHTTNFGRACAIKRHCAMENLVENHRNDRRNPRYSGYSSFLAQPKTKNPASKPKTKPQVRWQDISQCQIEKRSSVAV